MYMDNSSLLIFPQSEQLKVAWKHDAPLSMSCFLFERTLNFTKPMCSAVGLRCSARDQRFRSIRQQDLHYVTITSYRAKFDPSRSIYGSAVAKKSAAEEHTISSHKMDIIPDKLVLVLQ